MKKGKKRGYSKPKIQTTSLVTKLRKSHKNDIDVFNLMAMTCCSKDEDY